MMGIIVPETCCVYKKYNKVISDTIPAYPYLTSNTQQTKNETTNVVIQQHSRKPLMMDIFMSETCWAYKKYNKILSDI